MSKNEISNLTEVCFRCHSIGCLTSNIDGEMICADCLTEVCERCEHGEQEVETRNEYICSDCYSGMIDDAYESTRD